MPAKKTGTILQCIICGKDFYRSASHIKRGISKTCGASECKSANLSGERNPFWGRGHSDETKEKISQTKRARPNPNAKGPKGYKHTQEAREKMSMALKERWRTNREFMIANLPRGEDHHWRTKQHEPRHRSNFTSVQKREWLGVSCTWCGETEDLVLDHIIPVMAGGKNVKSNSQTLCRYCNLWKTWYVDRPYYFASLDSLGGQS